MNILSIINKFFDRRILFLSFLLMSAFFMAYPSLKTLHYSTNHSEYYSHIVLIPFVSIYLLYQKRKSILSKINYSFTAGLPLIIIGCLLYFTGLSMKDQLSQNDFTSIIALSSVVFISGAFILIYGTQAFKSALFPFLFLIFIIPIPSSLLDGIIHFLQVGSTEVTNMLLMATDVPFLRDGFVFYLPGQSVEVAQQCSGIRSSIALFITAVLAGHLFLKSWWKKVILVACIFPIAMFKNGIRIASLTLLGVYIDPRILQSSLHRDGGIPFFVLALVLMAPILYFLRKSEGKKKG
ncbi:MAG TPA: exosortase/archaeosortase family protein [Syntrophales bacterium]|nr:exosortase/archaeosortase family protein [Syntrophales bacterium]